ncbi:hypothetical protein [Streptomyces sp. bgisy126]|uniref:hypothetical protein n=1 Tax=unclassified Streptomyces TaxID=2593676 RepID=UPI003EB95139
MSLKNGIDNPRTPLRRFLDRELSAGARLLRENFRAQHRTDHLLIPPPGVGTEAGTVGTAIDTRLRLAFSADSPVDLPTRTGIELCGQFSHGLRMRAVGNELASRLTRTVHTLDLANRELPLDRAHDEEERLARLPIAAAWYQVCTRSAYGFTYTPLFLTALEDPDAFTLDRLLHLPHPDLVTDVVAQLHQAANGPLAALRAHTRPEDCIPGPTFPGAGVTADADLIADGLLIDFKSTRNPRRLPQADAWQLLGYLLLDYRDRYTIDTVGLYLTRSGVLATWPVEEYLALLGTCRRDLAELRAVFRELLTGCQTDAEPLTSTAQNSVRRLLQRLAPVASPGHCPTCTQPLPDSAQPRKYCTPRCRSREQTLRNKGLLAEGHIPAVPTQRTKRRPNPGES